ncbi:MAG: AAA family ATPase [Ichthyobacteriaceae bacterium]|nr:AAA family ATPase [Ichthyobacteriaceae bacterium]
MNSSTFKNQIISEFPFIPTQEQAELISKLAEFIISDNTNQIFLLKGYAGTGKTTIISTVVNTIFKAKKKAFLLAPTGRAAKVIGNYSGKTAFTIHRRIYKPKISADTGVSFIRQTNTTKDTIFFVDEASMISDTQMEGKMYKSTSVLDDLMEFIDEGVKSKIIFIGDEAQLPPVNLEMSPALDANNLGLRYNKEVIEFQLKEVLRQDVESGILRNATNIRNMQQDTFFNQLKFSLANQTEVIRLTDGYDIESAIVDSYSNVGMDETSIIVRSNKRANLWNQQIRNRIMMQESEISAGDILMIVKNNYFWLDPKSAPGFIANGDTIEVLRIIAIKELYGFRFAEIEARLIDYPNEPNLETVVMLDTISIEAPSLPFEDANRLYNEVNKDYEDITSNYKRYQKVKENVFFNALQIKFAYAITCHKSQGGQWDTVFIEQAWLPDGEITLEYLRWLYTAATRAKKRLYLLGFKDEFFENDEIE